MFAVPWPGLPGLTLCLNFISTLSRPMRAIVAAHSPVLKSAQALEMKGAACSAVRHSSGNLASAHELDVGMMAWIAAAMSTSAPVPDPDPDPVPVLLAHGDAVVAVAACLAARGEAVANPPRRRAEKCWTRILY
jgi:hypothetical protein